MKNYFEETIKKKVCDKQIELHPSDVNCEIVAE